MGKKDKSTRGLFQTQKRYGATGVKKKKAISPDW